MNLKEIKELLSLMKENNLSEIEVEREGNKIKLKKSMLEEGDFAGLELPRSRIPVQGLPDLPPEKAHPKPRAGVHEIASPMVGTFYRAPSPESPPFIETGQNVEVGQVVCIIEAMKLMNEIKSEVKGKITEALVENGEPVEFGQPLFVVEAG